jgi:hypothetical protein
MGLKSLVFVLAAGAVAITAVPAEAATKKRTTYYGETRELPGVRVVTRLTVTRRSYLDAGTEVTPGTRKFLDYVYPIGGLYPLQADWPSTFINPYGRTPLPSSFAPWP